MNYGSDYDACGTAEGYYAAQPEIQDYNSQSTVERAAAWAALTK